MSSKNSFASAQAIAVITTLSLSLVNCSKLTSSHPESASTSPAQGNDTAPASPVTTSPVIPPVIAPPVVTAPIVPAPLKLSAGTYKSVVSLCTSFQPFCLESLVITGSTFQATYNFILASDGEDKVLVVATGTYTLSTGEVTLTQQSLLLTSPAAVLGNVNCPGLVVTAGVPVDVAGKTCNSTNMWNNGGTDGTKFFQVNDGTLNERISGIVNFGDPKIYHLDSSLMLQTPLAAFDPGPATLTAGNYVSAFTRYTFPGVVANSNPAYNARLDSIDILGNAYTVHATLWSGITVIANFTGSGTFTSDIHGHISFSQNSLSLKPTAGNAQNVTCDGIAINEGQTVNVAGAICNGMSLHGAGDLFAADLTLINSTTISPCPENYVNCQADATSSYFLK